MSWLEKLCKTYENNSGEIGKGDSPLLPLYHTMQNAQLHVVLDGNGNFRRADVVTKESSPTMIPATEESGGRSGSKIAPHPLCDTLQYVAGDYLCWGGNPTKKKNESGFEPYINALQHWSEWAGSKKLSSVYTYLNKGCLISDLVKNGILFGDDENKLLAKWDDKTKEVPPIFKVLKASNKKGQFEAFVRFSVEISEDPSANLWEDTEIRRLWIEYYPTLLQEEGLCMSKGTTLKTSCNHPKNIRYPGDGAKLISSNDSDGFTYRGRFTSAEQACTISFEATQKAHNALRWLIAKQGRCDGSQAVVAWAVSRTEVPDPLADSLSMLCKGNGENLPPPSCNTAQELGLALSKLIGGYSANPNVTDEVVVMELDSASPGRMSICFYRELMDSEFFKRIKAWHDPEHGCVWFQNYGKDKKFLGAPAPRDIAECAYGQKVDDKLRRATVSRLLPCIIDGVSIPVDIVNSCVRRASSPNGIEPWEWEKSLGIACALYKHYNKGRNYKMSLEKDCTSRDYLYGRLLALADHIEARALYLSGENRSTNASRYMQRFASHPLTTWGQLEDKLQPYMEKLSPGSQDYLKKEMDEIHNNFIHEDYISDKKLSGEFLLGFHSERAFLRNKPE